MAAGGSHPDLGDLAGHSLMSSQPQGPPALLHHKSLPASLLAEASPALLAPGCSVIVSMQHSIMALCTASLMKAPWCLCPCRRHLWCALQSLSTDASNPSVPGSGVSQLSLCQQIWGRLQ